MFHRKIAVKAVMSSMHHAALAKAVEVFVKIKYANLCRIRISGSKAQSTSLEHENKIYNPNA